MQDAIFTSAYFSSIATDEAGVIQIFNVGAERMLGYLRRHQCDQIQGYYFSRPAPVEAIEQMLTVRIVSSGYRELESIIEAINSGAIHRVFSNPWDNAVLRDHLREAFRHHALMYKRE